MPKAKLRPLTAKQQAFIEYYCNPASKTVNNAMQSAIRAGYAKTTANNSIQHVLGNVGVKAGIEAYTYKNKKKLEHNRDIAINLLNEALDMARKQGNTTAIIAATRELNAISNLHGQTITTKSEEVAIPEAEQNIVEEATRDLTVRLSRNTG